MSFGNKHAEQRRVAFQILATWQRITSNSCQVTGRHTEKPKGPIVGHAGAIVENVEKGKEAPNWSLSSLKANGQQSEPEGVPTKRVACERQERPK